MFTESLPCVRHCANTLLYDPLVNLRELWVREVKRAPRPNSCSMVGPASLPPEPADSPSRSVSSCLPCAVVFQLFSLHPGPPCRPPPNVCPHTTILILFPPQKPFFFFKLRCNLYNSILVSVQYNVMIWYLYIFTIAFYFLSFLGGQGLYPVCIWSSCSIQCRVFCLVDIQEIFVERKQGR